MNKLVPIILAVGVAAACKKSDEAPAPPAPPTASPPTAAAPPSSMPPIDATNIASIAMGSKDHTTLVAAVKAADYVPSIANSGPLTVFAPTNAAFEKLPAGTVETLLKPEKQADLREILKYHVTTSVYEAKDLKEGMTLGMANGAKVTVHVVDGQVTVNDAKVLASIRASNGIVHVIDAVLLPPTP